MTNNKVLLSSNTFWNIYIFRQDLIKKLQKENFDVYLLASDDEYKKYFVDNNFKVYQINYSRSGTNIFKEFLVIIKYLYIIIKIWPSFYISFTHKPNIYGSVITSILNIPTINNITGLGYLFINKNFKTKVIQNLFKISFYFSKAVIFQNNIDKEFFINLKIIKKHQAHLINGSGVDLNKFKYNVRYKSDKDFIFLFIGRIIKDKGIYEFLESSKKLSQEVSNIKFIVIGEFDNKYLSEISIDYVKSFKNVQYVGFKKNIYEYIKNCDCVVLPSYREGLPKVLIEACAVGRPIITSDVPGCNEVVIDNFNGFLCKVKNSNDLYIKMKKMYNLPPDKQFKLGTNSRNLAEKKFDSVIINNKYIKIIRDIQDDR